MDFFIYLVNDLDLAWLLGSSNGRLVAQVWPGLLFIAFLLIRPPLLPTLENAAPQPKAKPVRKKNRP